LNNAFSISPNSFTSNSGTIDWTYTITEDELDFLAVGETVTLVFDVTITDGATASDTEQVTIIITGTNDAPVLTPVDVSGQITEGSTLSDTGSLTFADLDQT